VGFYLEKMGILSPLNKEDSKVTKNPNQKTAQNNQWAGQPICGTASYKKQKSATNNEWASTEKTK